VAKFEVHDVMRLPGRPAGPAVVFIGRIIEGKVGAGMKLWIEAHPRLYITCSIEAVENMDGACEGESIVGLLCPESGKTDPNYYSNMCPPGTVIEVIDLSDDVDDDGD
jgi:hypothetical protein